MTDNFFEGRRIVLLSGEGLIGVYERYHGKPTMRAIKARITKERCGGTRWCQIYVAANDASLADNTYYRLDDRDLSIIGLHSIDGQGPMDGYTSYT